MGGDLADGDKQDGDALLFSPAMAADLAKLRAAEPEEEEEGRRVAGGGCRGGNEAAAAEEEESNGDALLSLDDGDAFAKFGAALRAGVGGGGGGGPYAGVPASIVLLHLLAR